MTVRQPLSRRAAASRDATERMAAHACWPGLLRLFRRCIQWLSLAAVCAASVAAAQQAVPPKAQTVVDPYPLRRPDTSSPRDTLRSFLESADYAIKAWERAEPVDARTFRNLVNAAETLDFSTTPYSEALSTQTERVILLKEILDRIDLPPADEIPGDDEIAARGIGKWTIADTRITIARIDDGPRVGEFLFSAATVERLDAYYRMAKDLPYKATATTPGAYEAYIASGITAGRERLLRSRLQKVDTSSPRSSLVGFLDSINRAYTLVKETDDRLASVPPQVADAEIPRIEAVVEGLLSRATDILDLSQLPEAYRQDAGLDAALQIKEVLDRTLLPFLEAVPDAQVVEAARRSASVVGKGAREQYRWRYPNTEIEIVEVMEGERRGQFLFSSETVRRAGLFYEKVRDLPYRSDITSTDRHKYEWSEESRGVYSYYTASPGYVVPKARFLGRLVDNLPAGLKTLHGGQASWKWIALAICAVAAASAGLLVFRFASHLGRRLKSPMESWVMTLPPVLVALIVLQLLEVLGTDVNITGGVLRVLVVLAGAIVTAFIVWAVVRVFRAIAETAMSTPRAREGSIDASMIRIGARIAAFLAGSLIIIYSLRRLGTDMVPLLAGLGVGGLAVALAAQRTFANFIGSLILFANKPVRVGDFCRYGDQLGTVEYIGLLATRIRSLERSVVTVPNAELSEMKLDNYAMRDQRLLKTVLQLRYETTPEQMRYILAKLRELLLGHPKVTPAPARVRFVGYGAYSKDVEIFAYLDCEDQDTFLAIQEDILLRVEDIVNEAGSGFAFPSQTAYLTRDKGLDAERQGAAEAAVDKWRGHGKLPFPEFEGDDRHRLENILDYPPQGSPDYVPPKAAFAQPGRSRASTLSVDDLLDLPALSSWLRGKHWLAEYLLSRWSEETRTLLADYAGGRDTDLKEALVRDFNAVILGPSIYDEKRFGDIDLRDQTKDLILRNPEGEELARLNRLLMEDAFPKELARLPESS